VNRKAGILSKKAEFPQAVRFKRFPTCFGWALRQSLIDIPERALAGSPRPSRESLDSVWQLALISASIDRTSFVCYLPHKTAGCLRVDAGA
jgi:hypothetical protein